MTNQPPPSTKVSQGPVPEELTKRFFAFVPDRPEDGCWEFTGGKTQNGYGRFWDGQRSVLAHRFSYEHHVGPIPDGLQCDHLCRNRACVNPGHLEPVTNQENARRGVSGDQARERQLAKTHCHKGHPYSGDNLYVPPDGSRRECRQCKLESQRAIRRRKEAQGSSTVPSQDAVGLSREDIGKLCWAADLGCSKLVPGSPSEREIREIITRFYRPNEAFRAAISDTEEEGNDGR